VAVAGRLARLAWRKRGRRPVDRADALAHPARRAQIGGGLRARPSVLVATRDRVRARW
jgi:hypothetical protein